MSFSAEEVPSNEVAIVCKNTQCLACGARFADISDLDKANSLAFSRLETPTLEIISIEKKSDKFTTTGRISAARCPVCGMAIDEINRAVPVELQGLSCHCGGKDFNISISSIKQTRAKNRSSSGRSTWISPAGNARPTRKAGRSWICLNSNASRSGRPESISN